MNYHIVILMAVVVCALALPLPDEEVPVLQKATEKTDESTTPVIELDRKPLSSLNAMEEGIKAVVGNLPASGSEPKLDLKSEKNAAAEKEAVSAAEDDIVEVPKSLPVKAREETEAAAPPFNGVRAEPKEGVEIAEAKSTASVPEAEETEKKQESSVTDATTVDAKPVTESTTAAPLDKKSETSVPEILPKAVASASPSTTAKPAVAGETKTEATKKPATEKSTDDHKVHKEPHTHSSEGNKSEESAESKESEESNESNKSK